MANQLIHVNSSSIIEVRYNHFQMGMKDELMESWCFKNGMNGSRQSVCEIETKDFVFTCFVLFWEYDKRSRIFSLYISKKLISAVNRV